MKIFIPGNVPSSKNSRVWTGKFFIASKAVAKWRKETKPYWETNKVNFLSDEHSGWHIAMKFPVKLEITFVRNSKHKFDYINPCQTIMDEMVKHGYIEDDNADVVIPIFKPYIYDKANPGVYLEIL